MMLSNRTVKTTLSIAMVQFKFQLPILHFPATRIAILIICIAASMKCDTGLV